MCLNYIFIIYWSALSYFIDKLRMNALVPIRACREYVKDIALLKYAIKEFIIHLMWVLKIAISHSPLREGLGVCY